MAIDLKQYTGARVGLGRCVSTQEVLRFSLDHARAQDAIHAEVTMPAQIEFVVESKAPDRATYLRRPDLGRRLAARLPVATGEFDLVIVVSDGLSPLAVSRHAEALLRELLPRLEGWKVAPLIFVRQGRVAVADEIGEQVGAKMSLILLGERPGLSSPDSLGAYLTWAPRLGRTDAERNCVSNIRPEGFPPAAAAAWLAELLRLARGHQLTGVHLKGESNKIEG